MSYAFEAAYREAMVFTDCNCDNPELEGADFSDELSARIADDCRDFLEANAALLGEYEAAGFTMEQAGHDFWLTRNGHGAGFWDRGLPGDLGKRLTQASKVGSVDLYAGYGGLIYAS